LKLVANITPLSKFPVGLELFPRVLAQALSGSLIRQRYPYFSHAILIGNAVPFLVAYRDLSKFYGHEL